MARNATPSPMSDRESIDIRKIDNGFILRRSGEDSKGHYHSCETFSTTKPEVSFAPAPKAKTSPKPTNALGAAVKSMKRK